MKIKILLLRFLLKGLPLSRRRTPRLKYIQEEVSCLSGEHEHCSREYYDLGNGTQIVKCAVSGEEIKKIHMEDSNSRIDSGKIEDFDHD